MEIHGDSRDLGLAQTTDLANIILKDEEEGEVDSEHY